MTRVHSLGINLSLDITFKRTAMFTFPRRTMKIFNWEHYIAVIFTVFVYRFDHDW